jgi:hypothetical protein
MNARRHSISSHAPSTQVPIIIISVMSFLGLFLMAPTSKVVVVQTDRYRVAKFTKKPQRQGCLWLAIVSIARTYYFTQRRQSSTRVHVLYKNRHVRACLVLRFDINNENGCYPASRTCDNRGANSYISPEARTSTRTTNKYIRIIKSCGTP